MNMSNLLIKEGWISANKCHASDQCKELVDFFVTLQTHAEPLAKALLADRQLHHGSGSRALFAEALEAIAAAASRLSVARGFYLHNRMAFLAIRDCRPHPCRRSPPARRHRQAPAPAPRSPAPGR